MKKSIIFYFIALVVSLSEFVNIFLTYISMLNLSKIDDSINNIYYLYLVIVIIAIPLFILSIIKMIKSLKESKDVSKKAIFYLMLNLFIMFFIYSYLTVYYFKKNYNTYTKLMEDSLIGDYYKIFRNNLFIDLIISYIHPIIYIISIVLAYIFKSTEDDININKIDESINENFEDLEDLDA